MILANLADKIWQSSSKSLLFIILLKRGNHWQTVWLTDWLYGHVENIILWSADRQINGNLPNITFLQYFYQGSLYSAQAVSLIVNIQCEILHFPIVCLHTNATKYQRRWIRKQFGDVQRNSSLQTCCAWWLLLKNNLFRFIIFPYCSITEARLHSTEHLMVRQTANTENVTDEWQITFLTVADHMRTAAYWGHWVKSNNKGVEVIISKFIDVNLFEKH